MAQLLLLTIITHNTASEGRISAEWAHTPVASRCSHYRCHKNIQYESKGHTFSVKQMESYVQTFDWYCRYYLIFRHNARHVSVQISERFYLHTPDPYLNIALLACLEHVMEAQKTEV